jgi:hypothetical protein
MRIGTLQGAQPRKPAMNRIALFLLLASPVFGQPNIDITARGIKLPMFDAVTGKLTKRLEAESATGPLDEPHLLKAVVLIFADGPEADPMARIFCDDATYHRPTNSIDSNGLIHLLSAKGKAEGEGYQYDLNTNRLRIKSHCHLETDDYLVDADEADLLLTNGAASDQVAIRELDARGNVTVIPKASAKATFEQAVCDHAWYKAGDQVLHLSSPVHTRTHGRDLAVSGNLIEIHFRAP